MAYENGHSAYWYGRLTEYNAQNKTGNERVVLTDRALKRYRTANQNGHVLAGVALAQLQLKSASRDSYKATQAVKALELFLNQSSSSEREEQIACSSAIETLVRFYRAEGKPTVAEDFALQEPNLSPKIPN